MFTLPPLPYAEDALAPHISQETIHYHYHKHHQGYIDKLNLALKGDEHSDASQQTLTQLVKSADGSLYNLAAQAWNHEFYWSSLSPTGGGAPSATVIAALTDSFGSVEAFAKEFSEAAASEFGSGWAWLVKQSDGKLAVVSTSDAGNPLRDGHRPLVTLDVWEHAYYLDFQNRRADYIEAFLGGLINWEFVEQNFNSESFE